MGIYHDDNGSKYLDIKEFNMNEMHPHSVDDLEHGVKCCVIGRPGSGKSHIVEAIMLYKQHIVPVSQIFSGTEQVNHFYANRTTGVTVYNEIDDKAVANFVKRQDLARKYLPNPWALQVLDDVTDDPSIMNKPLYGGYYKRGRHWAMIHILCLQYPMDLKPGMRSCVDYVFIMANSIPAEREKLYLNFGGGCIPDFETFCDLLDGITGDHTALVINNVSQSSKLSDRIFYFRADVNAARGLRFGCDDAYGFDAERRNPHYTATVI